MHRRVCVAAAADAEADWRAVVAYAAKRQRQAGQQVSRSALTCRFLPPSAGVARQSE